MKNMGKGEQKLMNVYPDGEPGNMFPYFGQIKKQAEIWNRQSFCIKKAEQIQFKDCLPFNI